LKRKAIEMFNLMDEVDVFARLEFELFAFGIIPSSQSLPLLRDREVIYVNLLPPRPPTPFSLTLAPPRAENSLVAEVRRPGTGLPYEVVYTQQTLEPSDGHAYNRSEISMDVERPRAFRKGSRFKEHMSESGSRKSLSVNELESTSLGKIRNKSPTNKVWYKTAEEQQEEDPTRYTSLYSS
jgi:hypothetical protein